MSHNQHGDEQERKLFVGGFDKGTANEEHLKAYFEQYGDVIDCTILRDGEKQSRGFGFVLFADASTVDKIMKAKKEGTNFSLEGHHMEVKRALPKLPRGSGNVGTSRTGGVFRKVFVGGLPSITTEYELRKYFETYGRVNQIELVRDHQTNRLRGFAFVAFEDEDSADKCLQRRSHEICKKVCEVKRAQDKLTKEEDAGGRRSFAYDNHDNSRQSHQQSSNGAVPSSGGLGMTDLNQMIQQAFLMGQQSGLPSTASPLLNLSGVSTPINQLASQSNNVLLQALINKQVQPALPQVPIVAPVVHAAPANTGALTQLAKLLQGGGIDPNALASLLKADPQGNIASVPTNVGKPSSNYSTSYPPVSSYPSSKYGPIKDDERKRAYRPY